MNNNLLIVLKVLTLVIGLAALASFCNSWFHGFILGNYFEYASIFMTVIYGISPLVVGFFIVMIVIWVLKLKNYR